MWKWVFGHFACAWLDSRLLKEHGSKGLQLMMINVSNLKNMFSSNWSNPPVRELYRSNNFGSTVRHELLFIELHEWRPKSNTCNKLWMVISCRSFYHCIFPSVQNEGTPSILDINHLRGEYMFIARLSPKKKIIYKRVRNPRYRREVL